MTPEQFDAWLTYFEKMIAKHLPARDSRLWQLSFWGGLSVFIVNHPEWMPPGWSIPPEWGKWVTDVSVGIALIGGKFGWSSAKAPAPDMTMADAPAQVQKVPG
jgi:hypothetical protein